MNDCDGTPIGCPNYAAHMQERSVLLQALHEAIARPMGVVPACAEQFYNPMHPALAVLHEKRVGANRKEG